MEVTKLSRLEQRGDDGDDVGLPLVPSAISYLPKYLVIAINLIRLSDSRQNGKAGVVWLPSTVALVKVLRRRLVLTGLLQSVGPAVPPVGALN